MEGACMAVGTHSKRVGKAIKACRDLGPVSQDELAAKVGLKDGAVISAYEAGDKMPTLERAIDMAYHLGVSMSQLVGEHNAQQLPLKIVQNVGGDNQRVYMHVEGTQVLLEDLERTIREVVQQELEKERARMMEEMQRRFPVLSDAAREQGGEPQDGEP